MEEVKVKVKSKVLVCCIALCFLTHKCKFKDIKVILYLYIFRVV
jgi:hypothetical protein